MPPRYNKARKRWEIDEHVTLPSGKKKRLRRKSPINSKASAREYGQQAVRALLDSSTSGSTGPVPTFGAFAKDYLKKYAPANNRSSTAEVAESTLRVHLIPAFGKLRLDEIGAEQIEAYKAKKLVTHAESSVVLHLAFLRLILNLAVEWGRIDKVAKVRAPKVPPGERDHLSRDEVQAIVAAADEAWRPVFTLMVHTGMRVGEVCALQWPAVGRERLVVRHTLVKDRLHPPKGGKERVIPLNSEARAALAELPRQGPWVFPVKGRVPRSPLDGPIRPRHVARALLKAYEAADLRHVTPHVLRHTFASQLVAALQPLSVVQQLMGHSSIHHTEGYAHLGPGATEAAVKALEPRRKKKASKKAKAPKKKASGKGRGSARGRGSQKTGAPAERRSPRKGRR